MIRVSAVVCAASAIFVLAACGEKSQNLGETKKKVDEAAYAGSNNEYSVKGLKAGDKTTWEQQMRARAQLQTEYSRN